MFTGDSPIKNENDDLLDRKAFAKHLGKTIGNWRKKESLVIALNGEWGIGKTSIINMALANIYSMPEEETPTVVTFNPWVYSDLSNLTSNFFEELSKELSIQNSSDKDKKIAEKLKVYSNLLNLLPDQKGIKSNYDKLIVAIGLSGMSLGTLSSWFGITSRTLNYILWALGVFLIVKELTQGALSRFLKFFEDRSKTNELTAIDIKQEIKQELLNRDKKLVIIIDDIDRLTHKEIKEIFRLIKINADFPNTIYLLSFDKEIVEKNLDVSLGTSGKKYMEKIIQVAFDVPEAQTSLIQKYLFDQLDKVISILPSSAKQYFSSESTYWPNIYYSGLQHFFKNLRLVKRFVSSLEFNISQMYKENTLEVNPIDFIAVEAIRVFTPDFYDFMKKNKELFTSTQNTSISSLKDKRQKELLEGISNFTGDYEEYITPLLKKLFPQLENVIERGYTSYGPDWIAPWNRELRVCSPLHFDSYFVYLPKGSNEKVSQYELEIALGAISDREKFDSLLNNYVQKRKFRDLIQLFHDYTNDKKVFPQNYFPNLILCLLNLIDNLPEKPPSSFDPGADWEVNSFIYQLLIRDNNQEENFKILHTALIHSNSLYGAIRLISFVIPREDRNNTSPKILKDEHLSELQQLCVQKILNNVNEDDFLDNERLLYILYRWKEWEGPDTDNLAKFIEKVINKEELLLRFLRAFKVVSSTQYMSDYVPINRTEFRFEDFKKFIENIGKIREILIEIKESDSDSYKKNRDIIELFLTSYNKKGYGPLDND